MARSNAISAFILSVSDPVEKGIADIKHQLRRRGGELVLHDLHLVKDKNTDHAVKSHRRFRTLSRLETRIHLEQ